MGHDQLALERSAITHKADLLRCDLSQVIFRPDGRNA
jgi:hypothetical protein